MSTIKGILEQLEGVRASKNKKALEQWICNFQNEIQEMEQNVKNYYLLLLAQVYAVNLRNLPKAFESLKQVETKSELIAYEHQLRLCYFRFLEGDYDQAINGLNLIKVTKDNSAHSNKITRDFFQRLMPNVDEEDQIVNGKDQQDRQGYQNQFFKALKLEKNKQIQQAKRIHIQIYNKYGNLSPSIKYEAAKHIMLLGNNSSKLKNDKQYKTVITQFELTVPNKQYYYKKIEFLQLVLEILQDDQQEEPINYELIGQFVVQMIDRNLAISKDNNVKTQLKQLRNALLQQPNLTQQICYKFLGDKIYKKLLKQQQQKQKQKKNVVIKQPSIKMQDYKSNKIMKQTYSQQSQVSQPNQKFTGSVMTKINMNSGGYEDRYFYIREDFKATKKLYYCKRKGRQSQENDFYRLKGFKKIDVGKKSQALRRQQCQDFEEEQCFTLKIDGEQVYQRNFYVPDKQDFKNWIALFKSVAEKTANNVSASNIKKTIKI